MSCSDLREKVDSGLDSMCSCLGEGFATKLYSKGTCISKACIPLPLSSSLPKSYVAPLWIGGNEHLPSRLPTPTLLVESGSRLRQELARGSDESSRIHHVSHVISRAQPCG